MPEQNPPVEVASNEGLGLAPERAGQPRMMIIIDGAQEDETGHWYSPAAVCKVLRLPPSEHEHWNAALSVRSQAIDDDPMPCGHADILDDDPGPNAKLNGGP